MKLNHDVIQKHLTPFLGIIFSSVATSSMVGYILGIGDRHVLNILIDELTAEVIHIDFGLFYYISKIIF